MARRPAASARFGRLASVNSAPRVGIIGGGQLARMMYEAAIPLGLNIRLLAETPDVSAAQVVVQTTVGDYTDLDTVVAFAAECDIVTFDHEHVPPPILRHLEAAGIATRPSSDALEFAQDKASMRIRLSTLGIACPDFEIVADAADLIAFGEQRGWPVIAKTSRGGYDGKGVWLIDSPDAAVVPFAAAADGVQIIAEEYIDFARELSALVVRNPSGQAVAYPVSESVQRGGVCVETTTPAPGLDEQRAMAAQQLALTVADELDVVGVLAVELMERASGELVVNELAMRPHNTGHWTIDGAQTSQFENHLRAVCDLPLGAPHLIQPWTTMVNVLGGTRSDIMSGLPHCLAHDNRLNVHFYGKPVTPGRKVGHVTTTGADRDDVQQRARHAAGHLMGDSDE